MKKKAGDNKKIILFASGVAVVAIIAISLLLDSPGVAITGSAIKEGDLANIVETYFEENLLQQGIDAEVTDIKEEHGLFKVTLTINGESTDIFVTIDGELLFTGLLDLTQAPQIS